MKIISLEEAVKMLQDFYNQNYQNFFGVKFVKRTTGEDRKMVCRFGVKKYLAGGLPPYNFLEKKLLPVWDSQVKDYRVIPLDFNLKELTFAGEDYKISESIGEKKT